MKSYVKVIGIMSSIWVALIMVFGSQNAYACLPFKIDTTGLILLNQVGYMPTASKIALIRSKVDKFTVVEAKSGNVVFTGATGKPEYWSFSGDTVRAADFTSVTKPGKYRICIEGNTPCSYEFSIKKDIYNDLAKASMKAFYFNRCSYEITKEFGGKWARPAGHPDTSVIVHESAASKNRPTGSTISSPGGWYDAGDYNKYIVNCGITMYTLLLFYQMYPEYCNSLNLNIPESNNDLPDVVDEMLYNLKWMLTMQDPDDGGVYHKLADKDFGGFIMPDKSTQLRYVVQKTTAATLDFAAVMAFASRIFADNKNVQLKALSKTCLDAANKAMTWAKIHPFAYYEQPKDFHTGLYGDNTLTDEFFWAKTELALTNKDKTLVNGKDVESLHLSSPSWVDVQFLGIISLAFSENPEFKNFKAIALRRLVDFANMLVDKNESSAYKVYLDIFRWGCNAELMNRIVVKLIAFRLTGDKKFLPAIQGEIDYILGKNATGYCFVTGFGTRSPMHIHHRPSGADGVAEPVPGFLVGGPTFHDRNNCQGKPYPSDFPAKSYLDEECSYSTNEIAINWNAALFFVIGALDAMAGKN